MEEAVVRRGLHAAGFVSHEAAPAFDPALTARGSGGFPLLWFALYDGAEEVDLPAPTLGLDLGKTTWQASIEFAEFAENVSRIKELIRSGDSYQVNYTYRLIALLAAEPWDSFLHLVAAQEARYGAFVDTGEWLIGSASPELFFRLDGHRIVSRPMKRTAGRGRTLAEDQAQAKVLQTSEKERAENVMIVDMVRHDLGRVAEIGSVTVPHLFALEKYPTVWQMTSTIEARSTASLSDIFRALLPPALTTGTPKVRTVEIIAQLKPSLRRIYTGTIGFIAPGRHAQFTVAIRTLFPDRKTGRASSRRIEIGHPW